MLARKRMTLIGNVLAEFRTKNVIKTT